MSIKMNMKIEQAVQDINDIKSRLQALEEKAYSSQPRHNDFLPVNAIEVPAFVSREAITAAPPVKRRRRTKGIDKRTKAYKESRNNIKSMERGADLT